MNYDIYKVGGVIIQDKKLLICRSKRKEFFVAPGGKIESHENPQEALVRELREELDIETSQSSYKEFGTFYAQATGEEEKTIRMDVYIVPTWKGIITPSNEIEEIKWIDSMSLETVTLGSIFEYEVIPRLKESEYIT